MWCAVESKMQLDLPPLRLQLDLTRPEGGLQVRIGGAELGPLRLLQLRGLDAPAECQPQLQDHYLRGADLIASYERQSAPQTQQMGTQVYWRSLAPEAATWGGVELIVSAQTEQLDSDPRLIVGSRLPARQVLRLCERRQGFEPIEHGSDSDSAPVASGGLLYRLAANDFSYLEMIHPADRSQVQLVPFDAAAGILESRFSLFDEHLEKGVIRRGRMAGIFLPRGDDQRIAWSCYQRFINSPLPLAV